MLGRPAFFGWPYYAWSAGHDTNSRERIYRFLVTGADGSVDAFRTICHENNIKYIIDCDDFYDYKDDDTQIPYYNRSFIRDNFNLLAKFGDVYRIYSVD